MNKTSALIISAIALASSSVMATPAVTPDAASSLGLLLTGIVGLMIARRFFKTA